MRLHRLERELVVGRPITEVFEHEFVPVGRSTRVRDRVEYALPLGWLGQLGMPLVRRDLARIFDYRGAAVARLLR